MRELYRVLEVDPSADFDTIRESYRRLLKRYHPDSGGPAADPTKLDRVVEAFRRISSLQAAHRQATRRHSSGPRQSTRRRDGGTRGAPGGRAPSGGPESAGRAGAGGAGGPSTGSRTGEAAAGRAGGRDTRTHRQTGPDVFSLGGMLTGSPDARTREFAARRLADTGRRSAYPHLRRGLKDGNRQVVLACLEAIGRLRVAQSAGDLSAVFHASDPRIKRAVIRTVSEIDRLQLFRNLILAGLEDEDPTVRRDALRLFVKLDR